MSVQLIPNEKERRSKFTPQQKLQILKEWEGTGNGIEVAQKYQIHPQTLYRWKQALEQGAQIFLESAPLRAFSVESDLGRRLDDFEYRSGSPLPIDPHRLFLPLRCGLGGG